MLEVVAFLAVLNSYQKPRSTDLSMPAFGLQESTGPFLVGKQTVSY
jgi:hypothetical protein